MLAEISDVPFSDPTAETKSLLADGCDWEAMIMQMTRFAVLLAAFLFYATLGVQTVRPCDAAEDTVGKGKAVTQAAGPRGSAPEPEAAGDRATHSLSASRAAALAGPPAAMIALTKTGSAGVAALVKLMDDDDSLTRWHAVWALGSFCGPRTFENARPVRSGRLALPPRLRYLRLRGCWGTRNGTPALSRQ